MIETLRQIKKEDIYFFYELANDPEVRKNSFSVRPILWEEHEKWFYKKLQAGGVYLYLIDETPVGQIRFDIEEKTARISYTVAAAYRGKGYGSKMLRLAEQRFQEDYPQITQLTAQVKVENEASQKIFIKNGFMPVYIEYVKMSKNGNWGGGLTSNE